MVYSSRFTFWVENNSLIEYSKLLVDLTTLPSRRDVTDIWLRGRTVKQHLFCNLSPVSDCNWATYVVILQKAILHWNILWSMERTDIWLICIRYCIPLFERPVGNLKLLPLFRLSLEQPTWCQFLRHFSLSWARRWPCRLSLENNEVENSELWS